MISLQVLLTSMLVGFAAAQNSTSLGSIPASVQQDTKNSWCSSQSNSCPYLCGGRDFLEQNICLGTDLTNYICKCTNGSSPPPDIGNYIQTLPNLICNAEFVQCRQDTPGSAACKSCGTLDPLKIPASTSTSSAASSTQAPTGTTVSAASATATSTKNSAGRLEGGVAMGVLAAVGVFL